MKLDFDSLLWYTEDVTGVAPVLLRIETPLFKGNLEYK